MILNLKLAVQSNVALHSSFIQAPRIKKLNISYVGSQNRPYTKYIPVFWTSTEVVLTQDEAQQISEKVGLKLGHSFTYVQSEYTF